MNNLAEYLRLNVELARLGAELRKDGRADETWTPEEESQWERIVEPASDLSYDLTAEEKRAIAPVELLLAEICRGEWKKVEG